MLSPVKIWRRQKEIRKILGKEGIIISWTKIYVATDEFKKQAPYFIVLIELEDKKRVIGQLVDFDKEKLNFGLKVKAVLRRIKEIKEEDIIPYGVKFKLVDEN
ncbi:MAG: OB-fold domain-containing protein [Patescibacteria group bacterium]|nr:OB-fold domain-containing protein [Patescibacteria group bacterium]